MKKQEFLDAHPELLNDWMNMNIKLMTEYAMSNNTVKLNDLVMDIEGKTMRVDFIGVLYEDDPQCYYLGIKLNKDGKQNKRKRIEVIYQRNLR